MQVVALAVVACTGFAGLCESARRGSDSAHTAALFEGVLLLIFAGLAVGGSFGWASVTCRGGCLENTPLDAEGWWYREDPWQWDALFAVALLGFAAVTAALVWTARRRHRRAAVAMTAATAALGAWALALVPAGDPFGI
jgi:hypothetical protein